MKEHFFSIAGAVVRVCGADTELFDHAGMLEDFRVSSQPWDHTIFCSIVDQISPPEGNLCFTDCGRLVFSCPDGFLSYTGPVSQSWETATIRVLQHADMTEAQFLRSMVGSTISVSGMLSALGTAHLAVEMGGFLLHASCICHNNRAVVFTAPSGTGKSTQAELWHIHRNAEIINGDRIMIRAGENGWEAVGVPFCGTSGIRKNVRHPLAAIICLEQASKTCIRPIGGVTAFRRIWEGCTLQTWNHGDIDICSSLLQQMLESVPVFLLSCTPDHSAIEAVESVLRF